MYNANDPSFFHNNSALSPYPFHHRRPTPYPSQLLWTDPQDPPGRGPSKRGVGLAFGPDVTQRWCILNGITSILRSHEVRQAGFEIQHDGLCCTVFSAPNYCDSTGNKGAWARIADDGEVVFESFGSVKHPDLKPMAYSSGFGFAGGM
jgi:serine/threonine-protein phosphatase 5